MMHEPVAICWWAPSSTERDQQGTPVHSLSFLTSEGIFCLFDRDDIPESLLSVSPNSTIPAFDTLEHALIYLTENPKHPAQIPVAELERWSQWGFSLEGLPEDRTTPFRVEDPEAPPFD